MQDNSNTLNELKKQTIIKQLSLEIAMLRKYSERHYTKPLRYFNSTAARQSFAQLMCLARLTETSYSITEVSNILQISRLSAQSIVNDTLAEGWIVSTRGKHGRRLCAGGAILEEMAYEWIEVYRGIREKYKVGHAFVALDIAEELLTDKIEHVKLPTIDISR